MSTPTVTVTATGRAACAPDQVHVRLAVEVGAPTVDGSLRGAATAVAQLLGVLEQAGVGEADRRTSGLSVEQQWGDDPARPRPHTATYRLDVVVRDLDAAGRLVQAAGEQVGDALRVHGFDLGVAGTEREQEQARRAAVAACRERAGTLADAAGARLGRLLSLREGGDGHERGTWLVQERGLPLEGGALEVTVTVQAVWELEPR